MKNFLETYVPADRMFTSREEVELITATFDLNVKTDQQLQDLRNQVVQYYHDRLVEDNENLDACYNHWIPAMQSITAVIDNVKYSQR